MFQIFKIVAAHLAVRLAGTRGWCVFNEWGEQFSVARAHNILFANGGVFLSSANHNGTEIMTVCPRFIPFALPKTPRWRGSICVDVGTLVPASVGACDHCVLYPLDCILCLHRSSSFLLANQHPANGGQTANKVSIRNTQGHLIGSDKL